MPATHCRRPQERHCTDSAGHEETRRLDRGLPGRVVGRFDFDVTLFRVGSVRPDGDAHGRILSPAELGTGDRPRFARVLGRMGQPRPGAAEPGFDQPLSLRLQLQAIEVALLGQRPARGGRR